MGLKYNANLDSIRCAILLEEKQNRGLLAVVSGLNSLPVASHPQGLGTLLEVKRSE